MKRRTFATLAALAPFAPPAAGRAQSTAARESIAVAPIGSTDMTPFFYALSEGLFEKAGLTIVPQQAPTGAASITAVVGNAANIGFANLVALSTAHQRGIPVVVLAPGVEYLSRDPNVALLANDDGSVKGAKDLEGKVVGVTGLRDLLAAAMTVWLEKNGADASKVKFAEMPPSTMASALKAKRVDAVAVYEPFVGSVRESGAKIVGRPYDAVSPAFVNSAWFALKPWVDAHRGAAARFAAVLGRASDYTNTHYDDILPLIAGFTKLPVSTLQNMVHAYVPNAVTAPLIQPVIDVAARAKIIAASFPADEILFTSR